ncbi:hypothetical protein Tco_0504763 [Tanacetum coccineum]
MTSFDYRLNPIYAIKECSTCGVLYTADFCCSNKGLEDKILVPKPPRNCARVCKVRNPFDVRIVMDVLFYERNLRKICLHIVWKMNFSKTFKMLPSHPMTIPTLLMLLKSHSLMESFVDNARESWESVLINSIIAPESSDITNLEPCNTQTISEPLQNLQSLQQQLTSCTCKNVLYKRRKKKSEWRKSKRPKSDIGKIPNCDDDDDDYTIAITPVLPTKEPVNSLSMGDEHLDTIPATESDEVIKSSVENLIPIPSEPEAFYDNHIEEKSSGSTTTHADFSQYDSFIFDLSINPFPPADRSNFHHEEFADELAHIISPPEYDHFCFKIEPELGNLTMDVVNDIFPTREPRVHVPNVLPTHPTLDTDFILLSEPLFAYIVWIFLAFLTYPVVPPYILSTRIEDTIFDPGISMYHSFMPDVSHRSGTFMKFNVYPVLLSFTFSTLEFAKK